jgi:hypothetical protein
LFGSANVGPKRLGDELCAKAKTKHRLVGQNRFPHELAFLFQIGKLRHLINALSPTSQCKGIKTPQIDWNFFAKVRMPDFQFDSFGRQGIREQAGLVHIPMLNEENFFHDPTLRRNSPLSKTKSSNFLKKISDLPHF